MNLFTSNNTDLHELKDVFLVAAVTQVVAVDVATLEDSPRLQQLMHRVFNKLCLRVRRVRVRDGPRQHHHLLLRRAQQRQLQLVADSGTNHTIIIIKNSV